MEYKTGRPYIVLLIKINNINFAIPLRTNIRHSYCYKFKNSDRETDSSTGLDFSKAIVVSKSSYLGDNTNINKKEYVELQEKIFFIIKKFKKYVNEYIIFKKDGGNDFIKKKYKFSTLKYFDEVLIDCNDKK